MSLLKVIKGNEFKCLPIRSGTSIIFNKKIAEILQFDKTSNTYSYNIDVPETTEVMKILEWASDFTQNSSYRGATVPAILECDGVPLKGFLKITGHEAGYYKTQFISGNFNWWVLLVEKKLVELGYANTSINVSKTAMENIFAPNGTGANDTAGFVDGDFPAWAGLKNFGKWEGTSVKPREMQLDFYCKDIINKIEAVIPYKFKSSFFNSEKFRKALAWLSSPNLIKADEFYFRGEGVLSDTPMSMGATPYIFTNGYKEGATYLYFDSNGKYYFASDVDHDITLSIDLSFTTTDPDHYSDYITVEFFVEDSTGAFQNFGVTMLANANGSDIFAGTITMPGIIDGWIKIKTFITVTNNSTAGTNDPTWLITFNSDLTVTPTGDMDFSTLGYVAVLDLNHWIDPNLTCADFMRGIIHAFNLQVEPDVENGIINVEPYNEYYSLSSDSEEWTDIVDCGTLKKSFPNNLKRLTKLKFKDDGNDPVTKDLYSYTHKAIKRYDSGVDESENPFFSPSFSAPDQVVSTNLVMPRLWTHEADVDGYPDKSYSFEPRIFYKLGYKAYGQSWGWADAGALARAPIALQVGSGAHLGFSDSLFADYYARNFHDLENSDILNADVAMNFNKFIGANFRTPKMIKERGQIMYYRLLSILGYNTNGKTLTECEFQVWKK